MLTVHCRRKERGGKEEREGVKCHNIGHYEDERGAKSVKPLFTVLQHNTIILLHQSHFNQPPTLAPLLSAVRI